MHQLRGIIFYLYCLNNCGDIFCKYSYFCKYNFVNLHQSLVIMTWDVAIHGVSRLKRIPEEKSVNCLDQCQVAQSQKRGRVHSLGTLVVGQDSLILKYYLRVLEKWLQCNIQVNIFKIHLSNLLMWATSIKGLPVFSCHLFIIL